MNVQPYREAATITTWTPKVGEQVVIVESEWTRQYGYVGLRGIVKNVGAWNHIVGLDGIEYLLHVRLEEIAPYGC